VNAIDADPASMPLAELRARRAELQQADDAVSYVRRLAQARLDLAKAEQRHRSRGGDDISEELPAILGSHLTGGPPRPPRPADEASGHPLAVELDELCARLGATHLDQLDDGELAALIAALTDFEHARSVERQDLFHRIDALSAELVRRYRDGEADVDGLLADDA
jgi:hypothetical protein